MVALQLWPLNQSWARLWERGTRTVFTCKLSCLHSYLAACLSQCHVFAS